MCTYICKFSAEARGLDNSVSQKYKVPQKDMDQEQEFTAQITWAKSKEQAMLKCNITHLAGSDTQGRVSFILAKCQPSVLTSGTSAIL